MKIVLKPDNYVVAVSGGVDSMVLMDILARMPGLNLTVAHFDHGVRENSSQDRQFVQAQAAQRGLKFVFEAAQLGPDASEDEARQARYAFLKRVKEQARAGAIITAHHQDDLIETMFLQIIRGTGRKGLSSLVSRPGMLRPLLGYTKNELIAYAKEQGVAWREDATNANDKYLRNKVRQQIMPKLTPDERSQMLEINMRMTEVNSEIDGLVSALLLQVCTNEHTLVRSSFIMLPHAVCAEMVAALLRRNNVRNLSRRAVERLVTVVKTARPHTMHDVDVHWILKIDQQVATFLPRTTRKNS